MSTPLYWEEKIETMSRKELENLQLQLLNKTVATVAQAPFYQ